MATKRLDSISDQIAAARKSVAERPEWMKAVAHFSEPRIELANPKESQLPTVHASGKNTTDR